MAYIPGLTPRVNGMLPPSMNLRPGNNFAGHLTDATSPGPEPNAGRGGMGYGSYWDPSILSGIVNSQPGVMAANYALQSGMNTAGLGKQTAYNDLVTQFGDPTIAQSLGASVDPAAAALARANTIAGTSDIGKLMISTAAARQNLLASLAAHGLAHSGALGMGLQQQGLKYAQSREGLLDSLRTGITKANTDYLNTVSPLQSAATSAYIKQQGLVEQHPGSYGMPTSPTFVGPPPVPSPAAPHFTPAKAGPSLPTFGSHGMAP